MDLLPFLANKKMASIGTLYSSNLRCIMDLLLDDLQWIQSAKSCYRKRFERYWDAWDRDARFERDWDARFEPRYPESPEDMRALRVLRLNGCDLTGERLLLSYFRVRFRMV
jgi:hypothetical protein